MSKQQGKTKTAFSRRQFLKHSSLAVAGAAAAAGFPLVNTTRAATSAEVRIGLIGCGGRAGDPINEAQAVAESTMTGIIGREAVYSGKAIEWDAAMQSTRRLGPGEYKLGPYPTPEVAMPGRYQFT